MVFVDGERVSGTATREKLVSELHQVSVGDRDALRRVYDLTSAKLLGICLRVLKDRAIAEEVLQDVYVKVWRTSDRFDPARGSPITWLCTIARNTAVDRIRRQPPASLHSNVVPETLADDRPTADTVMVEREEQGRISDCIDQLAGHQAQCIRAAFFDGATYPQLAERLEVPLGTMKSWVRRGLLRLKECLDHG